MRLKKLFAVLAPILLVALGARAQEREGGYYRVTVTGYTCNRQTADDPLQRDGVDDEVRIIAVTYELTATTDQAAHPLGFYLNPGVVASAVMGDTNNHPDRVQGGSGHNIFGGNGGLHTGDSFPDETPWSPSPLFLRRRDVQLNQRPPMVVWQGGLYRGLSAVIIVPTIWEVDEQGGPGRTPDRTWAPAIGYDESLTQAIAKLATDPKADYASVVARVGETFGRPFAIPKQAAGEPRDRPVGMRDRGGDYVFRPDVRVLTYDEAEALSRRNFNGAAGVFPVSYRDDGALNGDYTLYLKVERLR